MIHYMGIEREAAWLPTVDPSALPTDAGIDKLIYYDDEAHVRGKVEARVPGYLQKEKTPATMVQAIRSIMSGSKWFSQTVTEKLAGPTETSAMTQRGQEVLWLVAQGQSNRQIVGELHIAEITVRFHLRNIYSRVELHTRPSCLVGGVARTGRILSQEVGKKLSL